ncbi:hypothetical protein DPMN_141875 [Dreissena polymorpha]|uniref:Uncharacterized protein n=1 Tax=Dreissena polymorpha TaxID=45954 RepID=A0A9D4GD64_DREPO|nr:hypothetical protein DPMN_141875 [Dreissena polymorpha]
MLLTISVSRTFNVAFSTYAIFSIFSSFKFTENVSCDDDSASMEPSLDFLTASSSNGDDASR